jgi:hypothetical protein
VIKFLAGEKSMDTRKAFRQIYNRCRLNPGKWFTFSLGDLRVSLRFSPFSESPDIPRWRLALSGGRLPSAREWIRVVQALPSEIFVLSALPKTEHRLSKDQVHWYCLVSDVLESSVAKESL